MINEFNFPDREWSLFITNVDLDYFLIFTKKFEAITQTLEIKPSFWHDTIIKYKLKEFENNKITIEYSEGILTMMFTGESDDLSKNRLKNIAEIIYQKMIENP